MSKETPALKIRAARDRRYAMVVALFNRKITSKLQAGCRRRLAVLGVKPTSLEIVEVPGAFELALAAKTLALTGRFAAVICLGAVVRGETNHYDYVCAETARGINLASLETGIPVVFGVLTCDNERQAMARCQGGGPKDAGIHAANTAVHMGELIHHFRN